MEELGLPLLQVALAAACPWPAPSGSPPKASQQKEKTKLHDGRIRKKHSFSTLPQDFVAKSVVCSAQHATLRDELWCSCSASGGTDPALRKATKVSSLCPVTYESSGLPQNGCTMVYRVQLHSFRSCAPSHLHDLADRNPSSSYCLGVFPRAKV